MPGIAPKCLDCGRNLVFDVVRLIYHCPACEEAKKAEEKKEAA